MRIFSAVITALCAQAAALIAGLAFGWGDWPLFGTACFVCLLAAGSSARFLMRSGR